MGTVFPASFNPQPWLPHSSNSPEKTSTRLTGRLGEFRKALRGQSTRYFGPSKARKTARKGIGL